MRWRQTPAPRWGHHLLAATAVLALALVLGGRAHADQPAGDGGSQSALPDTTGPVSSPGLPTSTSASDAAAQHTQAPDREHASAHPVPIEQGDAVRAIIGLVAIFVLAYIVGHPKIQRLEEMLGISSVVAAGFVFLLLGLLASRPSVGVLSPQMLVRIEPMLPLGLGWIGFSLGARFDLRALETMPPGTSARLLATTALPFAAVVVACGLPLLIVSGFAKAEFLRDAILLGAAAMVGVRPRSGGAEAPSATPAPDAGDARVVDPVAVIHQLQEVSAILALVLVAAFFRPESVGWQLPAIAWVFVALGMGTTLAVIVYAVLSAFRSPNEVTLLMLGSICLSAGLASHLHMSPIAVCFIAGALIFNLPATWRRGVSEALMRIERPIYLVFLVIAGARWQPDAWQGWALMILFVAARLGSRGLGMHLVRRRGHDDLDQEHHSRLALAPVSALAIAIVVDAHGRLYLGHVGSWIITTVVGGAIATEIIVQLAVRGRGGEPPVSSVGSHPGLMNMWEPAPAEEPTPAGSTFDTPGALPPEGTR